MPPQRLDRQPPPRYAAVSRAYNNSLRSVVVTLCLIIGIWTLIWAIDLFDERNVDQDHGQPKLALFALVIGILYISTTAISIFGIVAAAIQKEKVAKVFAWSTVAGAICVCGAGFLRVIVHFIHKNDLINECANVVYWDGVTFRFGIWGPRIHDNLDASEAAEFCKDGWNHDSVSEIISLIVELVFAAFFLFISFGYSKQVHQAKKDRKRALATATDFEETENAAGYPMHYNPPYLGYNSPAGQYAPPPGAPPPGMGMPEVPAYGKLDDPFTDFEAAPKGYSKDSLV